MKKSVPRPTTEIASVRMYPVIAPNLPPIPRMKNPLLPPNSPSMLVKKLPTTALKGRTLYAKTISIIVVNDFGIFVYNGPTTQVNSGYTRKKMVIDKCPRMLIKWGVGGFRASALLFPIVKRSPTNRSVRCSPICDRVQRTERGSPSCVSRKR